MTSTLSSDSTGDSARASLLKCSISDLYSPLSTTKLLLEGGAALKTAMLNLATIPLYKWCSLLSESLRFLVIVFLYDANSLLSGPTSTSQSADDDEGLRGTGWGGGGPVYLET